MKKLSGFLCAIVLVFGVVGTATAYEETFFDNFDDGDSDGWWLSPRGNWSIENGSLRQDNQSNGEDHVMGLVEDLELSDQLIETEVNTSGYGGVVLWYQDKRNYISVSAYPYSAGLYVHEIIDGVSNPLHYGYRTWHNTWYGLRVDVNSETGELAIYIDGSYIFTYNASTPNRTGQSGVTSGNGGAYFDDFKITYQVCDADYNGDGKINALDLRRKRCNLIKQAIKEAMQELREWKENCWLPGKKAQE